MNTNRHTPSNRDLQSVLPIAYLLRAAESEKPWPGEPHRGPIGGRRTSQPAVVALIVGTLLIIAVTAGLYALTSVDPLQPHTMTPLSATTAAPGAAGVILRDSTTVLVFAQGLPDPASGFRYVLWYEDSAEIRRLGRLRSSSPDSYYLRVDEATDGDSFYVTLEAPGRQQLPDGLVFLLTHDP